MQVDTSFLITSHCTYMISRDLLQIRRACKVNSIPATRRSRRSLAFSIWIRRKSRRGATRPLGHRDKYKRAGRPPGKNHSRFSSPAYGRRYLRARVFIRSRRAVSRLLFAPAVIVIVIAHVAVALAGERWRTRLENGTASDRSVRDSHERRPLVVATIASHRFRLSTRRLISFRHGAIHRRGAAGAICRPPLNASKRSRGD